MTTDKLFAPLMEDKWPGELDDMKSTFADKLNIYRTMAHHPSLLRAWANLREHIEWIKLGRRRQTPGRPVTFIVTQMFLDHFGMESPKDLPGIKELRDAGLLDNRPPPGTITETYNEELLDEDHQDDMFE